MADETAPLEVGRRFARLAAPVIGEGRAAAVCDAVPRIDALEDVSLLTRLLIPSSA